MSTLVQLSPFPEELDRGYLGRLMMANGCTDTWSAFALIERHFDIERGSRTPHYLLSRSAQMDSQQFGLRHTTVPLSDGISMYQGIEQFPETRLKPGRSSRISKVATHFCEECMKADIDFHGISYWRREHQTPGHLWCEKHQVPLRLVNTTEPGLRTPSFYIDQSTTVSKDMVVEAQRNTAVQRYLLLVEALYERRKPLNGHRVRTAVNERAADLEVGLLRRSMARVCIDDCVRDQFPLAWLDSVFGEVSDRDLGLWMHNGPRQVHSTLVILAALFLSCEEVDEAIAREESKAHELDAGRLGLKLTEEKSRSAIAAYRNALGIYSAVTRDSDDFPDAHSLKKMGLPDLKLNGVATHMVMRGLERFFLERGSIEDGAKASGLPVMVMEDIVRNCAPNMREVLRFWYESVPSHYDEGLKRANALPTRSWKVPVKRPVVEKE